MTSKNFNRVLTVVVNKLNKCYFNFTKPEDMKSVTIEKSVFLVEHRLGLEIDDCDMFLYITVDDRRMYEIDLDNEVKDSNELFNRVQYLLSLAYGGVYNGDYDELLETEQTEEVEEETMTQITSDTLPHVDVDCSNLKKVPKNSIYGMFGNMSLPCRVCEHFCTRTDTDNYTFEYCCRKNKENEKKAIKNLEWHHVSLNTLANLDFDMLDEKRQLYLQLYREMKELIEDLHKCKSGRAYDRRLAKMYIRNAELLDENKISHDYINYVTRKVSMCNVECGLWTSKVEESTGFHKSRRYNRHVLKY